MPKIGGAVSTGPKILLYDIETSHNLLAKFDLREEYTPHTNIVQERFVICAAWKLLGQKQTDAVAVTPKQALAGDDSAALKVIHRVLSDADVIVAHNGDRFDLPWLNGRFLFHKMPPLPLMRSVDTLKVAKRAFSLNSNRLDYLGKFLGVGGKTTTPAGLWLQVLKGDAKAINTMVAYNKRDVTLLEDVFLRLRPYVPDFLNREFFGGDQNACPKCGSKNVERRGYKAALTQIYQQFFCRDCQGWFRARKAEKFKTNTRSLP
jgi:hypothetical protein